MPHAQTRATHSIATKLAIRLLLTLVCVPVLGGLQACSKSNQLPNEPASSAAATASATASAPATGAASASAKAQDAAHAGVAWVKPEGASMDAIFAQAKASNKPVFLYWGAVWCPPCNQVKATVFNRPDFIERSHNVIPVYLDGDTQGAQKLGERFKVRGYPTMVLLRPDGSEITRFPGEVDAQRYLEVLDLAIHSGQSIGDALRAAQSADKAQNNLPAWQQLAYYAWEQDASQLIDANQKTATLYQLAQSAPASQPALAARLMLQALVSNMNDKNPIPEPAKWRTKVQQISADYALVRPCFDILVSHSADIAGALSQDKTAERAALSLALSQALDKLAADTELSTLDQLGAVFSKVMLAKLGLGEKARFTPSKELLEQARSAATSAEKAAHTPYERQALVPSAAELLSEVGLLDESDAMLKAELSSAISPYYHMLVLSANARQRGQTSAALDWSQKAWEASRGPATRLQWGVGYINRMIELKPQDAKRIESAATTLLAELEPTPETFYERNYRSLEKLGSGLRKWNVRNEHAASVSKLYTQMDSICKKLPATDPSARACNAALGV